MYAYLYQTVQQLNWAMEQLQGKPRQEGPSDKFRQKTSNSGDAPQSPAETFGQIKNLIIKSAEIVNSYCDTMQKRFDGLYLAQSDFGTYAEQTALELEANARAITQNYTSIQRVQTGVGGLKDRVDGVQGDVGSVRGEVSGVRETVSGVRETVDALGNRLALLDSSLAQTRAYIKTGRIGEDEAGIPVYGLEIGQTNEVNGNEVFNKYARFSSSRLSFYDQNDTEVAYISDYRLYITNVQVTGSLTIGEYGIDTADGLAFRWMGGNRDGN